MMDREAPVFTRQSWLGAILVAAQEGYLHGPPACERLRWRDACMATSPWRRRAGLWRQRRAGFWRRDRAGPWRQKRAGPWRQNSGEWEAQVEVQADEALCNSKDALLEFHKE